MQVNTFLRNYNNNFTELKSFKLSQMKKQILFFFVLFAHTSLFAQFTNYYSKSTGSITTLATWGTNTNGTGTSPSSFNGNNCRYFVQNRLSTTFNGVGNLIIGGNNSTLIIGNGLINSSFTIPVGYLLKADSIYIDSAVTLTVNGTMESPKAKFSYFSSVRYSNAGTLQSIVGGSYGKLYLLGIPTNSMWPDVHPKILKGDIQIRNFLFLECILYTDSFSLTIGESVTKIGTFNYDFTNYWGRVIGKVKRWVPAATGEFLFPFGSQDKKHQLLTIETTTAPSSGGLIVAEYFSFFAGNSGLPIIDTLPIPDLNINKINNGYYKIGVEVGLIGGIFHIQANPIGNSTINWQSALRFLKRDGTSSNWRLEPGTYGGGFSGFNPLIGIPNMLSINGQYVIASDSNFNTLPVYINKFWGYFEENQINLNWSSATEINAKEYHVSILDQGNWILKEKVQAYGNSLKTRNYTCHFLHEKNEAIVRVKLDAYDLDGTLSYSSQITLKSQQDIEEISLYPNPFSEQIQLQYFGSNQNHVADIFIYDHTGKLVTQESVSLNNTLLPSISTSHLNNGIYLVKIFVNGQMYWFKQLKNCL